MQPLRLCTFLTFIAVLKASGTSKTELDFVSIVKGDYDNKEQTQKPGDDHAFIQIRAIPVNIQCFPRDPVLFVEQAANGTIQTMVLAVVKDGINNTITETLYNVPGYTKYKPGEYDVKNLSNISCGDLQGDGTCIAKFRFTSKRSVFGDFPQCGVTENKNRPQFRGTVNCRSMRGTMPDQASPAETYIIRRIRDNYRLINPPQDYKGPCGN